MNVLHVVVEHIWDFNYSSILRRRFWRRASSFVQGKIYALLHTEPALAENMWNFGYDDTSWLTPDIEKQLEGLGLRPRLNKYALSLYYFLYKKMSEKGFENKSIIELSAGTALGYRFIKYLLDGGQGVPAKTNFSDIVFRDTLYDDLREEFIMIDVKEPETYGSAGEFDVIYSVENFHVIPDYEPVFKAYTRLSKQGTKIYYVDIFTEYSLKDLVESAKELGFKIINCVNIIERVNNSLLQQSLILGNWNYLDSTGLGFRHQRGEFYLYFELVRDGEAAS